MGIANGTVPLRLDAPPSELAVACAKHFEGFEVDEDLTIGGFLNKLEGNGR